MNQPRKITGYLLAWGLWAISSALGIFVAFWAVLDAIRSISEGATMRDFVYGTPAEQFRAPFIRNAVDRFAIVALGVLCVLFVVAIEHYYRTGIEQGRLGERVLMVTAIEVGICFVALAIQAAFLAAFGLFTIWSVLVPLVTLGVTVALSWLWTRMRRSDSKA